MIVSPARAAIVVSPVQLNGWPKATARPLHTNVVVPTPATVMSPSDMAAANVSPARSTPGGLCGLLDADDPMYGMNGSPCRSIAFCMCWRPRSVRPEAETGVFSRENVLSCAIERPVSAAILVASRVGTSTACEAELTSVPSVSSSFMSSAGVSPASVEPPPARP